MSKTARLLADSRANFEVVKMNLLGGSSLALAGCLKAGADSQHAYGLFFSGSVPDDVMSLPFSQNLQSMLTSPDLVTIGRMSLSFKVSGKHAIANLSQYGHTARGFGTNNVEEIDGVYLSIPDRSYVHLAHEPDHAKPVGFPILDSTTVASTLGLSAVPEQTHYAHILKTAVGATEVCSRAAVGAGLPVQQHAATSTVLVYEYDVAQALNSIWCKVANLSGTIAADKLHIRVLYADINGEFQQALPRTKAVLAFSIPNVLSFSQITAKTWAVVLDGDDAQGNVFANICMGNSSQAANTTRTWQRGSASWGLVLPDVSRAGFPLRTTRSATLPTALVIAGENFQSVALDAYGPVSVPATQVRLRYR